MTNGFVYVVGGLSTIPRTSDPVLVCQVGAPGDTTPPASRIQPAPGSHEMPLEFTLTATDSGGSGTATIRYTTDGSPPTSQSPTWSAPVRVVTTTVVRFFATDAAGNEEQEQVARYTAAAPAPTPSVPPLMTPQTPWKPAKPICDQTYRMDPPAAAVIALGLKTGAVKEYQARSSTRQWDSIIVHTTEGRTVRSAVEHWVSLANSGGYASAHYVIDATGRIFEVIDPRVHVAYHATYYNGLAGQPHAAIGIECVGESCNPSMWTPTLKSSLADLLAWLTAEFGVAVDHPLDHAPRSGSPAYAVTYTSMGGCGAVQVTGDLRPGTYGGFPTLDRVGILGHIQVQAPGSDIVVGHSQIDDRTDPGPYLDWGLLLEEVRRRRGIPALPLRIDPVSTTNSGSTPMIAPDGRLVGYRGSPVVHVTEPGTGVIVSESATGVGLLGSGAAFDGSVSHDGRHLAFASDASNLVTGDAPGLSDVFLEDGALETVELVSVARDAGPADGASFYASVSDDGRRVAFTSLATNLVGSDGGGTADVFVRDRVLGTTTLVSVTPTGAGAAGTSAVPAISGDGRFVAFVSDAADVVAGDANLARDVFLRDLADGATVLVSRTPGGATGNAASGQPSVSFDGRLVAFQSSASDLVAGDTNGKSDVFLFDREDGSVRLLSASPDGAPGTGPSTEPRISRYGARVAFLSDATNLLDGPPQGNVYVAGFGTGGAVFPGTSQRVRLSPGDSHRFSFRLPAGSQRLQLRVGGAAARFVITRPDGTTVLRKKAGWLRVREPDAGTWVVVVEDRRKGDTRRTIAASLRAEIR